MTDRENVKGIAARAALWSARHRTLAILGWIASVVGVTILGGHFGTRQATGVDQGHGDSQRADRIIEQAGFPVQPAGEMAIVQNRAATDRAGAVADLAAALKRTANVTGVNPPIVSADGRSSLVTFSIAGDPKTAKQRVQPALDAVAKAQAAHPGLYIAEAGDASGDKLIGDALDKGPRPAPSPSSRSDCPTRVT